MSLSREMKDRLITYLLQKIDEGDASVVKKTADAFNLTPASVHRQLSHLEEKGIVSRVKRGSYEIVSTEKKVELSRSKGELEDEGTIIRQYLEDWFVALPENVKRIWNYMAGEMINNIIDHSQAEHLIITLMQNQLYMALTLQDDGVGIFEKIRDYFKLDSTDEAVSELFKGKVTTDSRNHSGEGIFFSSRMADSFIIISSGKIFTHNRLEADSILSADDSNFLHQKLPAVGTTFYIKLTNDSRKTAKETFDTYADVDGGFLKTRILMRNYFDGDLTSRSQAKRLCAGLDRFEEIVLDFDGIDWMAQGFAHQLFVVFQNEHPTSHIIGVNMSEDVNQMWNHVMKS